MVYVCVRCEVLTQVIFKLRLQMSFHAVNMIGNNLDHVPFLSHLFGPPFVAFFLLRHLALLSFAKLDFLHAYTRVYVYVVCVYVYV